MDCPEDAYSCVISGECLPKDIVKTCDGISQCSDGSDEIDCTDAIDLQHGLTARDMDVATTIVIPTILACVVLVIGMLVGIHKCRQWEADRIVEMRRTRRIVQRLTARLREKNFNTLQSMKARRLRKRQTALTGSQDTTTPGCGSNDDSAVTGMLIPNSGNTSGTRAPPRYDAEPPFLCTSSPPPSYEDAVLDSLYMEFIRPCRRSTSRVSIF